MAEELYKTICSELSTFYKEMCRIQNRQAQTDPNSRMYKFLGCYGDQLRRSIEQKLIWLAEKVKRKFRVTITVRCSMLPFVPPGIHVQKPSCFSGEHVMDAYNIFRSLHSHEMFNIRRPPNVCDPWSRWTNYPRLDV